MFNNLIKPEHLNRIPAITLSQSQKLLQEGDVSNGNMFFVLSGKLGAYKHRAGEEHKIAEIKKGEFFGELGLISGQRRLASIFAEEDNTKLAILSKESLVSRDEMSPGFLVQVLQHVLIQKRNARDKFLRVVRDNIKVPWQDVQVYYKFSQAIDLSLAIKNTNLAVKTFQADEIIYKSGQEIENPGLYFVDEGVVELYYNFPRGRLSLVKMRKGHFFGEDSLLEGADTQLFPNKQALGRCKLLYVEQPLFRQLIKIRPDFVYDIISETILKLAAIEEAITYMVDHNA